MSGFGQQAQDTSDKNYANTQLANVFNYGLPAGQAGQSTGQGTLNTALGTLGTAQNYFQNQLTAGRAQTAQNAAPAINAQLASTDAQRRQQGAQGTGRTGGTAANNQTAQTTSNANVDNIIASTLNTQKQQGAQGLEQVAGAQAGIGGTQLQNSLQLLGLGQSSIAEILKGIVGNEGSLGTDSKIAQGYGQGIGSLLSVALGL